MMRQMEERLARMNRLRTQLAAGAAPSGRDRRASLRHDSAS